MATELRNLLGLWGAAGSALGLGIAFDLVRINAPLGLRGDELFRLGAVNDAAVFVPTLLVGVAAIFLVRWIEEKRPGLDSAAMHAGLASAALVLWGALAAGAQVDLEPGTAALLRASGLVLALFVIAPIYLLLQGRLPARFVAFLAPLALVHGLALISAWPLAGILRMDDGLRIARADEPPGFPATDPPLQRDTGRGRVIVLGIDALDRAMLEPLLAAGELPAFARLQREGVYGELATQVPTWSPRIWTSVATGRAPDEHGILAFDLTRYPSLGIDRVIRTRTMNFTRPVLDRIARGWRMPVSGNERRVKAIWNLCDEAGLAVGVVGWWATWPAEEVNGFFVSDHAYYAALKESFDRQHLDLPGIENLVRPAGLLSDLAPLQKTLSQATPEDIDGFAVLTDEDLAGFSELVTATHSDKRRQVLRTLTLSLLKDRFFGGAALALFDKQKPDVLFAYLNAVDSFGHAVFEIAADDALELGHSVDEVARYGDSIDAVVREADRWVGELLARVDADTTLIVLSDHGFQREAHIEREGSYGHNNAPPGVLFAIGKNVRSGAGIEGAHIDDIARTVIHLIGLPVSDELTGEVLEDLLDPAFLAAHPVRTVPTYEAGPRRIQLNVGGSAQDEDMLENLRALGYVR